MSRLLLGKKYPPFLFEWIHFESHSDYTETMSFNSKRKRKPNVVLPFELILVGESGGRLLFGLRLEVR